MELKEIRFKQGVSQWELSRLSGVHQSRISLIENGFPAKEKEKAELMRILGIKIDQVDWPEDNRDVQGI